MTPPRGLPTLSRRSWAGLLAVALLVVLVVLATRQRVPYVTFAPGPTINVLGSYDSKDIIAVDGRETYRDKGSLRLTTIVPSGPTQKISIPTLLTAWLDPDQAVYPYDSLYGEDDTRESVREESAAQMASSQDNAVAAALDALDIDYRTRVGVATVEADGPAADKLEPGDRIIEVDGTPVRGVTQVTDLIRPLPVGTEVALVVRRDGERRTVRVTTTGAPDDDEASALRVSIMAAGYDFPFDVDVRLNENIGGPSAGLMFALGIYDVLTPGSLTDGRTIAGTGEITGEGQVGPIGGIQQKLVGAQDDGAQLFLVPADNCAEALDGHYDPEKMRLVKVSSLEQAVEDVEAWVADPDAQLTRCTR